jgi:UDP-2-acetamido-3-amino-2,3-dideoxy-glucuronate N-acetyltransferase
MSRVLREVGIKSALRHSAISLALLPFPIFSLFPPLRTSCLRLMGAQIGKGVLLSSIRFFNYHLHGFKRLEIGDNCHIAMDSLLDLAERIVIHDHVTLAERVIVLTHLNIGAETHELQKPYPKSFLPVSFQPHSFVGAGSIILPGVTVGHHAMIGAGSVVTRDVAPGTLVAGNPAKFIKNIL